MCMTFCKFKSIIFFESASNFVCSRASLYCYYSCSLPFLPKRLRLRSNWSCAISSPLYILAPIPLYSSSASFDSRSCHVFISAYSISSSSLDLLVFPCTSYDYRDLLYSLVWLVFGLEAIAASNSLSIS